jgi:glycosyltransferase involved in cell wall biosynthesis
MRLLVLTHTFPPSYISNAKRPFYLVRGFLEAGWQVDVFTSAFGMNPGAAETVIHQNLRIVRSQDPVVRLAGSALERHGLFRAAALAASGVLWPDPYVLWALRTIRACRHMKTYDRILTFVVPVSLTFSGMSRYFIGPHCVFDYQESITPQFRRYPRRSPLHRVFMPLLAKLERHTLHKAGRVVFTADTNRRVYVEQGLAREFATAHVPYFFDAEVFRAPAPELFPGFQVVYFGTFDWRGERSPETFLRAFVQFLQRHPAARPKSRFLFYGNWLPEHNKFIDALNLADVVSLQVSVPYEQYLEKLKASPVLLLVVSSMHNFFMPSKIVDYFGAGRPILAFVPRDSEMRRVLEQAGQAEFASDEFDVAGGVAALEKLWTRYCAGSLGQQVGSTQFWSSEVQIPRYLELVTAAGKKSVV